MSWPYPSSPADTYDSRWPQGIYATYPHTPTPSGVPAPYTSVPQPQLWQDTSLPLPRNGYPPANPPPQLYTGGAGYATPANPAVKAPETPVTSYSSLQSALSLPPSSPRSPIGSALPSSSSSSSLPSLDSSSPSRRCSHCQTTSTPLWRRDAETLEIVCNACGLYQQQHACHRPAHLIAADGPADDSGPPPGHDGRVCTHCGAYRTSVWRRNKEGAVLCNACGVYLRLKGVDRPVAFHGQKIRPRARGGDKSGAVAVAGSAAPGA